MQLDQTLGTKGVEVIGASRRKKIRVPLVAASSKSTSTKKSASKKK
jgi:hypothetical protein